MNRPRHDLFSSAAFTRNEDRRVRDRDLLYKQQQPLHNFAGEDGGDSYEFASEHEPLVFTKAYGIGHKAFAPVDLTEHLMVVRRTPTDGYMCSGTLSELLCWS
jgi:hypothetical protein